MFKCKVLRNYTSKFVMIFKNIKSKDEVIILTTQNWSASKGFLKKIQFHQNDVRFLTHLCNTRKWMKCSLMYTLNRGLKTSIRFLQLCTGIANRLKLRIGSVWNLSFKVYILSNAFSETKCELLLTQAK